MRRLQRDGTRAHLEGLYFNVYYFTPRQVLPGLGRIMSCWLSKVFR